jgi:hypothetical protein
MRPTSNAAARDASAAECRRICEGQHPVLPFTNAVSTGAVWQVAEKSSNLNSAVKS